MDDKEESSSEKRLNRAMKAHSLLLRGVIIGIVSLLVSCEKHKSEVRVEGQASLNVLSANSELEYETTICNDTSRPVIIKEVLRIACKRETVATPLLTIPPGEKRLLTIPFPTGSPGIAKKGQFFLLTDHPVQSVLDVKFAADVRANLYASPNSVIDFGDVEVSPEDSSEICTKTIAIRRMERGGVSSIRVLRSPEWLKYKIESSTDGVRLVVMPEFPRHASDAVRSRLVLVGKPLRGVIVCADASAPYEKVYLFARVTFQDSLLFSLERNDLFLNKCVAGEKLKVEFQLLAKSEAKALEVNAIEYNAAASEKISLPCILERSASDKWTISCHWDVPKEPGFFAKYIRFEVIEEETQERHTLYAHVSGLARDGD